MGFLPSLIINRPSSVQLDWFCALLSLKLYGSESAVRPRVPCDAPGSNCAVTALCYLKEAAKTWLAQGSVEEFNL